MAIRAEVILQVVAGGAIVLCMLGQIIFLLRLQSDNVLRFAAREQPIPINSRWVFIHYHKSGHDIAKNLQKLFIDASCANSSFHIPKRVDILPYIQLFADADIGVLSAPDLQFHWGKLEENRTQVTKVVHFVRDPVELVLSGFLYHMQSPPPLSEHWLLQDLDICQPNPNNPRYNQIISAYAHANESIFNSQIERIRGLCQELQRQYRGQSVYQTMRNAVENGTINSKYDSIQLEATRSLISVHYGDLLRMTANAIFEAQAPPGLTYRVFTSELPVGELEVFTHTSNLLEYLMNDTVILPRPYVHQPFWQNCLNKSTALQQAIDRIYIPALPTGNDHEKQRPSAAIRTRMETGKEIIITRNHSEAVHITQGLMSPTLREYYKHRLLQDKVLGPVLHTIRTVLYSTGHRQSSETVQQAESR